MDTAFRQEDALPGQLADGASGTLTNVADVRAQARAHFDEKDVDAGLRVWHAYLERHPNDAEAANELGKTLHDLGRREECLPLFRRALAIRPGMIAAKAGLGNALIGLRRFDEAVATFESLLALMPDDAAACFNLGRSLRGLGRNEEAVGWLRKAFALRPAHADSADELGNALRDLKQTDAAIEAFRQALAIDPGRTGTAGSLGSLLLEGRHFDEAIQLLQGLVDRDPANLHAWLNLGAGFLGVRRPGEALASFRRALALQPSSTVAYCNMALALLSLGRLREAQEANRTALAIEPGSAAAAFNLGCTLLADGRFREGWAAYEYRFALGDNKTWAREEAHALPWVGEPLAGKSILVLGEQGNGDQIQFSRYLPILRDLGATVSYLAPPRLHALFGMLRGPIAMLSEIPAGSRFDYQCVLMNLPGVIERLELPIPTTPYLSAQPERVARWRAHIGGHGFRIGVVWQGHIYPNGDARRSFKLETIRPIAAVPGVRLISLQHGDAAKQLETLPNGIPVEALGADFDSGEQGFLDSCAVMQELDLVIACDTSMAHLAGALGRPVWIALCEDPEWRWQRERADSVWYPTARLFRQSTRDDWDGVFTRMAEALPALIERKAALAGSPAPAPAMTPASVEVSWGELLDKLTILEIKAERLVDSGARANVALEMACLRATLAARGPLPAGVAPMRKALRKVNEKLWDVEDALRECEAQQTFDDRFVQLARSVYRLNDERARVKKAINLSLNSRLVEEKQYRPYEAAAPAG